MEAFASTQQVAASWQQWILFCFHQDPASTLCDAFWSKAIAGYIVLGLVPVLVGIWKYVDYRRKYNAALRAQWLREQVDEAGIEAARWNGDAAYLGDIPDDEVLARIRAAVAQRKRSAGARPVA